MRDLVLRPEDNRIHIGQENQQRMIPHHMLGLTTSQMSLWNHQTLEEHKVAPIQHLQQRLLENVLLESGKRLET